jgi:hypothetical protein
MYEFKPYVPPWWDAPNYPKEPDPKIEQNVHESYREEVEEIKPLLLEELAQASAPFTGKSTACVITTHEELNPGQVYSGHTTEVEPGNFVTAIAMALRKIASPNEKIDGIYVMGQNLKKDKHVMPSPTDYDALSERFSEEWGPTIIIVYPGSGKYRSIWASVHGPVYGKKTPSDFSRIDHDEIEPELLPSIIASKTNMEYDDARFIAHLRWVCAKKGIAIYLTGSASGRGEISGAVKNGYTDIDLLVISDLEKHEVERIITELAERHFGSLTAVPMIVNDWQNNRQIEGTFLYDGEGNKKIQMHAGQTMDEINFRPSNLDRNYYHRVC